MAGAGVMAEAQAPLMVAAARAALEAIPAPRAATGAALLAPFAVLKPRPALGPVTKKPAVTGAVAGTAVVEPGAVTPVGAPRGGAVGGVAVARAPAPLGVRGTRGEGPVGAPRSVVGRTAAKAEAVVMGATGAQITVAA